MYKVKNIFLFLFLFTLPFSTSACQASGGVNSDDDHIVVTVEAFTLETLSDTVNKEGQYEVTGYKSVNSITDIKESPDKIYTKIISIEDYYDKNGIYLNTLVTSNEVENDYNTGKAFLTYSNSTHEEPLTIHSDKNLYKENSALSINEEKQIKGNVLKYTKKLPEGKPKEIQGITKPLN